VRRRGSIINQLLVAFSVFAVLIAIAAGVGYLTVVHNNQTTRQLTSRYQTLQHAQDKLGVGFGSAHEWMLDYALSGDQKYLTLLRQSQAQFAQGLATLQHGTPPNLRGLVADLVGIGAKWSALVPQLMAARQGTPHAKALIAEAYTISGAFFAANGGLQQLLTSQIDELSASSKQALQGGLAWAGGALAIAVLLVLAGSLSTLRTVTRPLRNLTVTVRRLTTGDHAVRAAVTGSAEVREVAQAVNAQANEADQFRAREAESDRLRTMARAAGIRIREPLTADGVIQEAGTTLDQNVAGDLIYLHLIIDGQVTPPVGHEDSWVLADLFSRALSGQSIGMLRGLLRDQASSVIQDVQGPDGERLPPWLRTPMRQAGIVSLVVTPFGVGDELLGFIAVSRLRRARPWARAEIDAVESIAADLGRGLNHARLYEAENRLVEHLKALDSAKSDFFATISHELRAPLSSIEGYIELLSEEEAGPVTPQQRQMLQTVDRSASRLRTLTDDVFTLAKLESGAYATVTRPVNMAEVIAGAIDAVRPSVSAAKLGFSATVPPDGLVVEGDASQLDRVLINLLSNSVKYTPEGGRIEVRAGAENGSAVVCVTDTGIGIPNTDQKKLFDRFFRASNAQKASIPGTGLGLAIVRTIVMNHGGDIAVASKEAEGTTVTVRLPLAAQVAGVKGSIAESAGV
jgi:two-component system, OmpR family, phosphate regulon sensor histidine kinase PhoR